MSVIESAVAWAIETANDNSHGYSQANRWGPDYDCSSFVISAYQQAGLTLREHGATYTGNMRPALAKSIIEMFDNFRTDISYIHSFSGPFPIY